MFRLYYLIFSISYYSLKKYYSICRIEEWDFERKKINAKINKVILDFLSRRKNKSKTSDQFFLDYLNFFVCQHISSRKKFYKNQTSKYEFIFYSFVNKYITASRLLASSFKNFLITYKLEDFIKIKDCTLCIGFPEHAFNYSKDYPSNPNSFIEFSLNDGIFSEDENILSIEEYKRASYKKNEKKHTRDPRPESFKRYIIKKKLSFYKIITIWPNMFYLYIKSAWIYKTFSFSVFSYFLRNRIIYTKYYDFYKKLTNNNINVNHIIFLHKHYVYGSVFKGINQNKFKTFNYSQNYHIPTSEIMSDWMSQSLDSPNIKIKLIMEELNTRLFSEFYLNPINFSNQGKFFSKLRGVLNEEYDLKLIDSESSDEINNKYHCEKTYSNLGYENFEFLDLESRNNILFCDNSIESREDNISRDMFGDFIALEEFMYNFYKEIISVAKSLNYNLYYKGKYWQDQKKLSILDKASLALNYEVIKIDPYSKLIFSKNKKFDCIINYPFTSTYYTFGDLGEKNLFFIPTIYINSFNKNIRDICLGRNNLEKTLRKKL